MHIPHTPPDYYLDGSKIAGQHETRHMDMLAEMDKVVGSLVNILEEQNLIEDTIILFASDNGGLENSSGPLRGWKGSIYEGGHRIPMILRWDNGKIPKSESRDRVVGLNDVYATLCDFAGIKIPHSQAYDSVSFADYTLDESNVDNLRTLLGTWDYHGEKRLKHSAIRAGDLKLIYNHTEGIPYLFNLTDNLNETDDIASENPRIVKQLLKKLKRISPCYDESGKFKVFLRLNKLRFKPCAWFKRKPEKRCRKYPEGRLHCGESCAMEQEGLCKTIRSSHK